MSTPTAGLAARLRPDRETLLWWAAIVNAEVLLLLSYFAFVTGPPSSVEYALLTAYPFVWMNLSAWAYRRVDPRDASPRRTAVAGAVAVGYLLVLSYFGGVVQPGIGARATGLRVVAFGIPPGFAPAVLYSGSAVVVNLVPFKVVGYLALAYLVYATVLDAAKSVAAGVVGLFSCVSCSFPLLATLASGIAGSGSVLAATVTNQSYGLSTLVFAVTVLLLVRRPDAGDLARLRAVLR